MVAKACRSSKSGGPVSSKCEFCKKTGSSYTVNHEREQLLPDEFNKFKVVLDEGFYRSIIRCRRCGTIYNRRRFIDNEINNNSDEDVFTEISEEKLKEILQYAKDRQAAFTKEIRRLFRAAVC